MSIQIYWKTIDCNPSWEISCKSLAQVLLPALVQSLLLCESEALNLTPLPCFQQKEGYSGCRIPHRGEWLPRLCVKLGNETVGKHLAPAVEQKGEPHPVYP